MRLFVSALFVAEADSAVIRERESAGFWELTGENSRCGHARRMGIISPEPALRRKLEMMSLRRAFVLRPDLPSVQRVLAAEPGAPTA